MPIKLGNKTLRPHGFKAVYLGVKLVYQFADTLWQTISGIAPLTLANALAHSMKSLVQHGKVSVSGSEITCNNGTLSVVNGEIVTTGNPEEIFVGQKSNLITGWVDGYYIGSNGSPTSGSTDHYTDAIPVQAGKTYVLSFTAKASGNKRLHAYSNDGTPVGSGSGKNWIEQILAVSATVDTEYNETFTVDSDCYVRFSCRKEDEYVKIAVVGSQDQGTTATAVNLYACGYSEDTQDIITGEVIRRNNIIVYDGTQEVGDNYVGVKENGNIIIYPKQTTYEGDVVTFTAEREEPLVELKAEFLATQDLHGQDAPYPAGMGKNKFNQEYYSTTTNYNQNYSGYSYTQPLILKPNTQYTFKANSTSSIGTAMYFYIRVIGGSDSTAMGSSDTGIYPVYNGNLVGAGVGNLFTTGETGAIRFGFPQNTTYLSNIMSVLWQLEESSTATPWSPYENICPITAVTEINVYNEHSYDASADPKLTVTLPAAGKNLWDESKTVRGKKIDDQGNVVDASGFVLSDYICVSPFSRYKFSHDNMGTHSSTWAWYTGDKTFISNKSASGTDSPIAPSNAYFVRVFAQMGATEGKFQVEKNQSATAYEPYRPQYGGYAKLDGGQMISELDSMIFNGSENWALESFGDALFFTYSDNVFPLSPETQQAAVFCDSLKPIAGADRSNFDVPRVYFATNAKKIIFRGLIGITTVEELKAWLAENPVMVVYMRGGGFERDIPQYRINTLVGQNAVWADSGDVTVSVSTDHVIEHVTPQPISTLEGNNTVDVTANVNGIEIDATYAVPEVEP